jgi:hypothetical protein
MPEIKSERTTHIGGNFEHGAIISGDNNNVFNLVYNFIYKQIDMKLSAGFVHLITLVTIAAVAITATVIFLSIVLFVYFPAETKARMTFPQFIITFVAVSAVCICFIFALLKVYQNIKILIIILIPLCMAFSIASAAYILDENVLDIIERMISFSNGNQSNIECETEPDFPVNPPCSIRYNEIKVETPAPKPGESDSIIIQDSSDSEKPPVRSEHGTDNSTSRTSRRARYSLRSEPITVSVEEFRRVFGLDKILRPLEYIQNDFKDNRDGTITDNATGLMWQKSGSPDWIYLREDVPAYIEKLNRERFSGYSDWRLPTVDELKSLMTQEKQSNTRYISPIFDENQLVCRTSDKRASGGVWIVLFDVGNVIGSDLDGYWYIRAVRSIK